MRELRFDRPRSLRQSMNWLHTWSGLLPGWLLFALFVTGTLSFFRNEITFWMQPELHKATGQAIAWDRALSVLNREAPNASQWTITLPNPRNPTMGLSWQPETRSETRKGPQQAPGNNFNRGPKLIIAPATGGTLKPRQTAGGNFLYHFHYELYGIDRIPARWIVGIATMLMLIAIVSGVIVHKKFFADFFTFRPARGKRSWLDAHALFSVAALPFHFVITFSGLLLFGNMMIPSAAQSALGMDGMKAMQAMRRTPPSLPPASGVAAPLTDLPQLIARAEETWNGAPAGSLTITNPGQNNATVDIRQLRGESLTAGRSAAQTLRFDGVSGAMMVQDKAEAPSVVAAISNVFILIHRGFFASPWVRWLLFISGVGGCLMIASGLVMWLVARRKAAGEQIPTSHRIAEVLNVAAIAGLLVAIGAYFWANRLIAEQQPGREHWEIGVFFVVWLATLAHSVWRPYRLAWQEQLTFAGLLALCLPLINAVTGGASLLSSIASGQGLLTGFDLTALLTGVALIITAFGVNRHQATRALKPSLQNS